MHPPRLDHIDLLARTYQLTHPLWPGVHACEHLVLHPHGLTLARPVVDRPQYSYQLKHYLPELGIVPSRLYEHGAVLRYAWYVDIARVIPAQDVWVARDLYLDVIVETDGTVILDDTDEYLAAIREGHFEPGEAEFALASAHQLVNGLARYKTLEAYLASEGIVLPDITSAEVLPRG